MRFTDGLSEKECVRSHFNPGNSRFRVRPASAWEEEKFRQQEGHARHAPGWKDWLGEIDKPADPVSYRVNVLSSDGMPGSIPEPGVPAS